MPLFLPARAVLFDMDGTLLDSTAVVETIWTDFAHRFELDPDVVLGAVHGVRAEDSVARFAPAGSDVAGIVAELNAYELAHTEGTVEVPGAAAFLAALPTDSVALVTSASPPLARARMAAAGLPLPATVVTAADVRAGKPAPDGYLAAAERLGVRPADAIVFEDADAGIRAGLAAGMRVVVVGGYVGPSTAGLPRLADYRAAEVRPSDDGFELVLPDPA